MPGRPSGKTIRGDGHLFGVFRKKEKTAESSQKTAAAWRRTLGGLFGRGGLDDEFWEALEEALIVSDVGAQTATTLVDQLKREAASRGLKDPASVRDALRDAMVEVLDAARDGDPLPSGTPTVLLVVGVNGAGKTTSIAKVTRAAVADGRKVMLAAADTFRAGAIEQIKIWGDRLGVPVIAQQAGSDPGAVAFDAMNAARSRGFDFVIIDTAGRLQTRHNLMEELKKIRSVVSREAGDYEQRVLLVIDGNTGQNGLSQARLFTEAVHCDGIMLTKLDSTARGGIALAISGELKIPVWFIGTGESAEDISEFDPAAFADALLPEPEPAA